MKRLIMLLSVFALGCASTDKSAPIVKKQYMDFSAKEDVELIWGYWATLVRIEPKYPDKAAKRRQSGCVDIIIGINEKGKFDGYKIRSSYPEGVFDYEAIRALKHWKFKATKFNKGLSPALTSIQVNFQANKNKPLAKYNEHCPKIEDSNSNGLTVSIN